MKKIRLSSAIALILLAIATTIPTTMVAFSGYLNSRQANYSLMQQELGKLYTIVDTIDRKYIGVVNVEQAVESAAAAYVSNIGDKWSYYLTAEDYKAYKESAQESLVGIGVSVIYDAEAEAILVTHVYEGSPAEAAGMKKLDYIVAVDELPVAQAGYTDSVNAVRGLEGTKVRISIKRGFKEETLTIERAEVAKVSVSYEMFKNNIGYIQISEFAINTSEQFKKAVTELQNQGAKGIVFDVRNNPGGYLTELVKTLDVILPEGKIITTTDINGNSQDYTSDSDYLDLPFAVLINENSISAGEFFPAAIQEYGLGPIIGTKTGGKGYTQQIIELSDGSAINLSTNKYYTPNGKSLAETGITPDIIVTLTEDELNRFYFLTEETDPQLKRAIEAVIENIVEE